MGTTILFNNLRLSRRAFLKYTGIGTGLYLGGRWFKKPSSSHADDSPRVVSIHDSDATDYDYGTYDYWEYVNHVNQDIANNMIARGVRALTGKTNTIDAWKALIPYQSGESVVMKVNLNNNSYCNKNNNDIDALPQTANAIINGLTSIGVPGDKIWITDPSRRVPEEFRNRILNPNIQYYSYYSCTGTNYHSVDYVDPSSSAVSLATCPAGEKILPSEVFVEADHLISAHPERFNYLE